MHINALKESKFLKKEDVDRPALMTIRSLEQINTARDGAPEEMKWCVHFDESDKPMVLNSTNIQLIAKAVGSEETDNWVGQKVVLYHDPTVSYAGKIIGGIRVRAPKNKQPAPAQAQPVTHGPMGKPRQPETQPTPPPDDPEDDPNIPF